jgi:hypothetical protein
MFSSRVCVIFLFVFIGKFVRAQNSTTFVDGRSHVDCAPCKSILEKKPKEVLFGIHVQSNGEIYFSMNNIEWFNKLFSNDQIGVSVDLISEDRYSCKLPPEKKPTVYQGVILPPVYRKNLLANNESREKEMYVKIGTLPASLKNKKIEENLIIINRNKICYYTQFVNIARNNWELLPMGLFADTLIKSNSFSSDPLENFTFSKKTEIIIPFKKGTSNYSLSELTRAYDSLNLDRYTIQKVEIRAYSSIEGTELINMNLMKKRGDAMIQFLSPYQAAIKRSSVLAAENWLEFFSSIKETEFDYLKDLSKSEIKQRLTDPSLSKKMEPLLATERKSVAVLYLLPKTKSSLLANDVLARSYKEALATNKISEAAAIQREVIDRISREKLPMEYLDKMEVPKSLEYISLANDREVYLLLSDLATQADALSHFLELAELDPKNPKVSYNICALKLQLGVWDHEMVKGKTLINEVNELPKMGIDQSLVKRMLINHNILKSKEYLENFQYDAKDSIMNEVRDTYDLIEATDEEIYSIAKYYSYYSNNQWSKEIIAPRIREINVNEDLLFYYINLLFYNSSTFESDIFKNATLNAINLNHKRYCLFFLPHNSGGASMQLLEHDELRISWCQHCHQ